jgi:hypothetical protein
MIHKVKPSILDSYTLIIGGVSNGRNTSIPSLSEAITGSYSHGIFFFGFVADSVNVPPLPMTSEELKTRITEARTKTDHDVSTKV